MDQLDGKAGLDVGGVDLLKTQIKWIKICRLLNYYPNEFLFIWKSNELSSWAEYHGLLPITILVKQLIINVQ